jgi:hypothetical protein
VLSKLGAVLSRERPDEATAVELESLEIFRGLGDRLKAANSLYLLGTTFQDMQRDNAAAWLQESLELYRGVGSRSGEGHALLGGLQRSTGDAAAHRTLAEGLQVLTDVGDLHCAANTDREMALLEIGDDPDGAEVRLRRALTMSTSVVDRANMALTMEALGKLAVRVGELERAVALYGAAESLLTASGRSHTASTEADREPEFDLAKVRFDEAAYQEAWDGGAAMTVDEAVEFASGQSGDPGVRP